MAELLSCSFCGKTQKQVHKLIAGPGVYICDECIDLCVEILATEGVESDDEAVVAAGRRLADALHEFRGQLPSPGVQPPP